jgi:transposase
MANKRLLLDDIQQMKIMVQNSVAPEDIAKHFNIAISSVHNYKNRFKKEGLNVPNVRGKRPTGSVEVQSVNPVSESKNEKQINTQSAMNFLVNGVSVQVSGKAKNVNISKDHIEVNF